MRTASKPYNQVACRRIGQRRDATRAPIQVRSGWRPLAASSSKPTNTRGALPTPNSEEAYFPYGDEIGTPAAGNVDKFGTYQRDATTGLDYADQRYFTSLSGRFLSSDPSEASGGAAEPGSWNRYPYVGGDPVNGNDPSGLAVCYVDHWNSNGGPWQAFVKCRSKLGTETWEDTVYPNGIRPFDRGANQRVETLYEDTIGADLDRFERQRLLIDAYVAAQRMLELEDCSKLFGVSETRANGWSPSQVLGNLVFGRGDLGSVGYGPTLGQEALTSPTIVLGGIGARININGDAWQSDTPGMNVRHRALTLLHEMGHAYNLLSVRGSGGSEIKQLDHIFPDRQDFNNTLMEVNCGTIPAIRR